MNTNLYLIFRLFTLSTKMALLLMQKLQGYVAPSLQQQFYGRHQELV
jgi:hypothetical protein